MEYSFSRNESSTGTKVPGCESFWNVHSRGTKVPQAQKFQGANVPQNETFLGTKGLSVDFSLPGIKVLMNEKSRCRAHLANCTFDQMRIMFDQMCEFNQLVYMHGISSR